MPGLVTRAGVLGLLGRLPCREVSEAKGTAPGTVTREAAPPEIRGGRREGCRQRGPGGGDAAREVGGASAEGGLTETEKGSAKPAARSAFGCKGSGPGELDE